MIFKRSSYLDSPLAKKFYQKWLIIELWCQNQSLFICVEDQIELKLPFITESNKRRCSRNPKPTIISFVWKIYQDVPGIAEYYIIEKKCILQLIQKASRFDALLCCTFQWAEKKEHFILLKTKQNKTMYLLDFIFIFLLYKYLLTEWKLTLESTSLFALYWVIQYLLGIKKSSKSVTFVQLSN